MKKLLKCAIVAVSFLTAMAISSQATEVQHHHPGEMDGIQKMRMMEQPCVVDGSPCDKPCRAMAEAPAKHRMMGAKKSGMGPMDHVMSSMRSGMMSQSLDHELFLDQVDLLGLSSEQEKELKIIRSECREENLHKAADVKIARLEMKELLAEQDWTLKQVEPLVRKVQMLEGDMMVRHLQAVSKARNVLTAEQLRTAVDEGKEEGLEDLFK